MLPIRWSQLPCMKIELISEEAVKTSEIEGKILNRDSVQSSMEMAVMDLEVELERWDAALKRLDRVALAAPRRDRWLMRRAEVLELAGRKQEAQRTWKEAQQEFNALPERLRTSKSGQQQAATLREHVGTP